MEKIEWKNHNRMIFNSDYKAFNKQTNVFCKGNAITNTQTSGYIRAYNETQCNNSNFNKGHLLNVDLNSFCNVPKSILNILKDTTRKESYILYKFRVYNYKSKESVCIGWLVADYNNNLVYKTIIGTCNILTNSKRTSAINEAARYITIKEVAK